MASVDDERDYRALVTARFDDDARSESATLETPGIGEALLVHADRMQRDGDPRGALITLGAARETATDRAHRVAIDREL
nr:hypothetical protein [Deltaproteobacteria bacterium]